MVEPTSQCKRSLRVFGAPVEAGASQPGAGMGPAGLRTAGLIRTLEGLGHPVEDLGDLRPIDLTAEEDPRLQQVGRNAPTIQRWTGELCRQTYRSLSSQTLPIALGGDHSLSIGTVNGAAHHCAEIQKELFVLWLDAHADYNTPTTSPSGNIHGMPLAMLCGEPGFSPLVDKGEFGVKGGVIDPQNLHLFGIRSVDDGERTLIQERGIVTTDMRQIDEEGVSTPLGHWLNHVKKRNGVLHVSLDVDFLDPELAPGAGTPVPGGASYREAHLAMEMIYDSGLLLSLDVAELNPYLDIRGRSARLLVDLVSSLFGRRITHRNPTRHHAA